MTKPFTWSYSALKEFEQCPRKYHAARVLKLYPFEESDASRYGNEVHKAIELYILKGTPMGEHAQFQPVVDALLAKSGTARPELRLGLTRSLQPCGFFDKDVWFRAVIDVAVVDEASATGRVVDWKTGSAKYPDLDQLDLMALTLFAHYPELETVHAALLFIVHNAMRKCTVSRTDARKLWATYRERVARIEACMASGVWNPKQNGLCKSYCPHTPCEFNGKH
jgi:RecB family exonuclease